MEVTVEIQVMQCPACGTTYGLAERMYRLALRKEHGFRCTNPECPWPVQVMTDTEVERLKARLANMEQRAQRAESRNSRLMTSREHWYRKFNAQKGATTRLRNILAKGASRG